MTSRPRTERVTAWATLWLGTLEVAASGLVVSPATQLRESPQRVLVLRLELKLGLVCHGLAQGQEVAGVLHQIQHVITQVQESGLVGSHHRGDVVAEHRLDAIED